VGQLLLGRDRGGARELGEPAGVAHERVQDLARRAALGELTVTTEVAREAGDRGATLLRQAQEARLRFQLLEHLEERAMAASGGTGEVREIGGGDRVPVRGGNRV